MIVTVFGIIKVLGITAQAKDETHAEAIALVRQAEYKKAIIGIVVVAVAAIIAIVILMM